MNTFELTLEMAKQLRNHSQKETHSNPSRLVPHRPLIWFAKILNVTGCATYFFSSAGRGPDIKRIYGKEWSIPKLEDLLSSNISKTHTLTPVTCVTKGRRKTKTLLGYLLIYTEHHMLNDLEVEAVSNVSDFLGDYMHGVYFNHQVQYLNRASKRVDEINNHNTQAGTKIRHTQGVAHRAMRAYNSYFCTYDAGNLIVDYYQRNDWNRPRYPGEHPVFIVSKVFDDTCRKNNFFQWVDLKQRKQLTKFLLQYCPNETENGWEYLIAVSKFNKKSISLWIFQFDRKQLIFYEIYRDLMKVVCEKSINSSRYLFQRRFKKMIIDPIFSNRDTRVTIDQVFIIMPFTESWSVRIWSKLLQPFLIELGLNPLRGDDLYGRDIMEDIWKGILSSNLIIADITGRNPNVFYELGIAHTLGKQVILLTQDINDIPFDLNRYRHIIYEDNMDGYEHLKTELAATIRDIVHQNNNELSTTKPTT